MIELPGHGVSRRNLLGGGLAVAGLAALTACGGTASGGTTSTTGPMGPTAVPTADRKRGGTFRFAPQDSSAADTMDPHSATGVSWALASALYNGLMILDHQMKPQLSLAEFFEPEGNDQGTWTVRVKDGVVFHNGKTLGADDVIFSIQRILDPKNPGFTSGLMGSIDPKGLKKLDDRTVRLTLNYPNSQLPAIFWQVPTAIVPVGFDPKNPVGTGPFKYKSNAAGQRFVAVRNEDYFINNRPYLDQFELVTFADAGTARFNALVSGQIDGMNNVDPALLAQLRSRSGITTTISETGAFEPVAMRCGKGDQFEDVRTRTAMKLIADRQQMVGSAYSGLGAPGNDVGVWSRWDPAMPDLAAREQDLDQARSLLKAAGQDGMKISFRVGEVVPGQIAAAEAFAQDARKAGVTVTIDKVADLAQFYSSKSYYTAQMKNDYLFTESLFLNIDYCWQKDSWANNTGYDNPKLNQMFRAALAKPQAEYEQAMGDVARLIYDDGPWMVWGRRNVVDAISSKFTGLVQDAGGMGFDQFRWDEISLA